MRDSLKKLFTFTEILFGSLLLYVFVVFLISSFIPDSPPMAAEEAWNWRKIILGKTTEAEILKFAGMPDSVSLLLESYLQLKKGETPKLVVFEYNVLPGSKPLQPILIHAPLSLSEGEVISITAKIVFEKGIVLTYTFDFMTVGDREISKGKYLDVFKAILGNPISFSEVGPFGIYYFPNHFSLTFLPDSPVIFTIELQCHIQNP